MVTATKGKSLIEFLEDKKIKAGVNLYGPVEMKVDNDNVYLFFDNQNMFCFSKDIAQKMKEYLELFIKYMD